jgi:hypothetical protein
MKVLTLMFLLTCGQVIGQQTVICKYINTDTVDLYVYKIIYHISNDSVKIDDFVPSNIQAYYDPENKLFEFELAQNDFYLVFFVNPLTDISKDMYIQTGPKSLDKPMLFTADFSSLYSLCVSYDPDNDIYETMKVIIPKTMF